MKHDTQLTQLTREERYQIHARNKAEHNQTDRAMILARDKSTVRRELQRNSGLRGYRPQQAQRLTEERPRPRQPFHRAQSVDQVKRLLRGVGVTGKLVCGSSMNAVMNGFIAIFSRIRLVTVYSIITYLAKNSAANVMALITAAAN